MWARILEVAIGGALGATARLLAMEALRHRIGSAWPFGTFFVNISGCLALGLIVRFSHASGWSILDRHMLVVVGFLGSFTTFSTFVADADTLWQREGFLPALTYLLLSVGLGFAVFWCARHAGSG
ncbi:MAG TPA: fluoride efflux transporter CrcB [Planctomycetota bacterium]|nr:fluoride efflux transporter CrcB [Planctomycetota bacterium]